MSSDMLEKEEEYGLEEEEEEFEENEMECENYEENNEEIEENEDDSKFVVRCTLGGCFKYYHVNCVYKNKNVSCINSMKVQRFRCPLHYCEFCQVSGDSVLIV